MSKNCITVLRFLNRLLSSKCLFSFKNEASCSYATSTTTKPIILGIETSCDDTGVAVLDGRGEILAETLNSQQAFSTKFGGVIPLFSATQHRANIWPAIEKTLEGAKLKYDDLSAVAVSTRPGLVICLQEGVRAALEICHKYRKPFIPIHHMKAHALTARMTNREVEFPYMCLLVSGGHSLITWVESVDQFQILGRNLDVAPGDVFDKVARRLKLSNLKSEYRKLSGGALIELLAKNGDPFAVPFGAIQSRTCSCDFSFSGITASALRKIERIEEENSITGGNFIPNLENMCAAVQHAVFLHLARKLIRAFEYIKLRTKINLNPDIDFDEEKIAVKDHDTTFYPRTLVVSGGVASNEYLRRGLTHICSHYDCNLVCPPRKYCTDNGVMIAWNGLEKWKAGIDIMHNAPLTYHVEPRCPIGEDISGQINRYRLSRHVLNRTHSSLKINYDFNKPVPDWRTKKTENLSSEEEKLVELSQ